MYNQMHERRSRFSSFFSNCLSKLLNALSFLAMIGLIACAFIYWKDLTPCYKREVAILCCCMIYWRCTQPSYPAVVWEAFQFFIIFLFGEKYNKEEIKYSPQCLDPQGSVALFLINITYKTALLCYAFLCSVYGLFIFMAVLMMVMRQIFVRPRRRRLRGLDQKHFDDLEQIEYHNEEANNNDADQMCSICLGDFIENERITQLPICNHYFHKECIQQWLKDNPGCPYCRANIKKNLRAWKRNKMQQPLTAPISEMELPNADSRQLV